MLLFFYLLLLLPKQASLKSSANTEYRDLRKIDADHCCTALVYPKVRNSLAFKCNIPKLKVASCEVCQQTSRELEDAALLLTAPPSTHSQGICWVINTPPHFPAGPASQCSFFPLSPIMYLLSISFVLYPSLRLVLLVRPVRVCFCLG